MSEEKTFDGIISADNKMPGWYIVSFVGTVIFAVVYLLYFHIFTDWTKEGQYAAEVAAHVEQYGTGEMATTGGNPLRGDAAAIAAGQKTFAAVCAACHGPEGKGLIGPDLTDGMWLHGTDGAITEDQIYKVVSGGVMAPEEWKQNPPKGPMPAQEGALGSRGVWEVIAFLTDKNKNIEASN